MKWADDGSRHERHLWWTMFQFDHLSILCCWQAKKKKKGLATSHIDGWILNKPATSQLLHAAMVQSGI